MNRKTRGLWKVEVIRWSAIVGAVSVLLAAASPAEGAIALPTPEPGPARSWHAQVQVSTYSSVNTFNGNMFTAIPIVSWSGVGPDMNFMLYHNSANWNQTPADTANVGFFLGPGWSISYSDHLLPSGLVWVHADGTRDQFHWSGGKMVGSPGTYDELERDSEDTNIWRVRHKDQSYHLFYRDANNVGRLTSIVDATGNALTLQYSTTTPKRLEWIEAAGRRLEFEYDANGLTRIKDLRDEGANSEPGQITDRYWTPIYTLGADGNQWMTSLEDCMNYRIDFGYELIPCQPGGIDSVQWSGTEALVVDADSYNSEADDPLLNGTAELMSSESVSLLMSGCPENDFVGRLLSVSRMYAPADLNDTPAIFTHSYYAIGGATGKALRTWDPDGTLNQRFTYSGSSPGYLSTTYYDRRGSAWKYGFNDPDQNLYPDGNLNWILDPTEVSYGFYYDTNRNLTWITDYEFNNWWTRYFDSKGNMTGTVDPLGHGQSWTYDAFNNVTSHTDAAGNITRFYYDHAADTPTPYPTLLTRIVEPGPGGNPPAGQAPGEEGSYPVTRLEYYLDQSSKHGQLSRVTDPNSVVTEFDYDQWGQPSGYGEGPIGSQTASGLFDIGNYVYAQASQYDSAGNTTSSQSTDGGGGSSEHDNHGNTTGSHCPPVPSTSQSGPLSLPPGFAALPCDEVSLPDFYAEFSGAIYSARDELLNLPLSVIDGTRTHTAEYDELGRQLESTITSNEVGNVTRPFYYAYYPSFGWVLRDGPDGLETLIEYDTANRLESVQRGLPNEFPVLDASFTYNGIGLLTTVVHGNGMTTAYTYDAARRVTQIMHATAGGTVRLRLDYTYMADDLPATITEYGSGPSMTADVEFTYDTRRRLIQEVRMTYDGTPGYNLAYVYDEGGNRTAKTDVLNNRRTEYHYDVDADVNPPNVEANPYGTYNNRLMYHKEFNTLQPGDPGEPGALVSTTWYYYKHFVDQAWVDTGNVSRVVTKPADSAMYESVFFKYARNNRTVTNVVGETWEWDGVASCVPAIDYDRTFAWEFRYDGARQRYLTRLLNPATLQPYNGYEGYGFTDYDGDSPYGDFSIPFPGINFTQNQQSYEPGLGRFAWSSQTNQPDDTTESYYHTDHLGTIRGMTNSSAAWIEPMAFTAFGERKVGSQNSSMTRFGYVGSYGYESTPIFETNPDTALPFLHVGARYYDPATGRFLQRDPIGIAGGTNVYAYAKLVPTTAIDPDGLDVPAAAGSVGEIGKVIIEGGEVVAGGAESSVQDAQRKHDLAAHPGFSGNDRDKTCRICKKLEFAERRRRARERNKKNYPTFCMPWNLGLNRWYE